MVVLRHSLLSNASSCPNLYQKLGSVLYGHRPSLLWNSSSPIYLKCTVSYTDFWAAYVAMFPSKRHRIVEKDSRQII
ncbi:hypothetical protein CCP3SC5AM1_960005 [Gammaproteobacteria bacterium]